MDGFTREALKKCPELFKKFEMSEAKYLMSTDGEYEKVKIELNLPEDTLSKFVACLAKYDMCFDEWACFTLINAIIQLEMQDDSIWDDYLEDDDLDDDLVELVNNKA